MSVVSNPSNAPLRVAIGSDHAGFELKQHLIEVLNREGNTVIDHGTNSKDSVDIHQLVPPWVAKFAMD